MTPEQLISLATTYGTHERLRLSTLGAYVVNDGKFFRRLQAGDGCTLRTAKRVIDWFDAQWPTDLEWPASIPRPSKQEDAA